MPGDQSPKKNWRPSYTYSNEYKKSKKMQNLINQSLIDQTNWDVEQHRRQFSAGVPAGVPNYNIISDLNG